MDLSVCAERPCWLITKPWLLSIHLIDQGQFYTYCHLSAWYCMSVPIPVEHLIFRLLYPFSAEGVMRTMTTEKLLKGMPVLQTQIDTLLEFDVSPAFS